MVLNGGIEPLEFIIFIINLISSDSGSTLLKIGQKEKKISFLTISDIWL